MPNGSPLGPSGLRSQNARKAWSLVELERSRLSTHSKPS
ncbi:hypothetical protein CCACVL1_27458 [Corchorus capsularis]|uniref:Uncharacterized protein n=1 Tax=Corchorus capsularis TaxID=210143 RepID=A0A1R3GA23_COCAP|nr:hypothetical protein CCACVL1_27458 [Corchorus capsularis]